MTQSVARASLIERAPQIRPEIAAAIYSTQGSKNDIPQRQHVTKLRMADILRMVSRATLVNEAEIKGPRRFAHMVRARAIYVALCRRYTQNSLPTIARTLSRDHTTLVNLLDRVRQRPRKFEPEMSRIAAEIETAGAENHG